MALVFLSIAISGTLHLFVLFSKLDLLFPLPPTFLLFLYLFSCLFSILDFLLYFSFLSQVNILPGKVFLPGQKNQNSQFILRSEEVIALPVHKYLPDGKLTPLRQLKKHLPLMDLTFPFSIYFSGKTLLLLFLRSNLFLLIFLQERRIRISNHPSTPGKITFMYPSSRGRAPKKRKALSKIFLLRFLQ